MAPCPDRPTPFRCTIGACWPMAQNSTVPIPAVNRSHIGVNQVIPGWTEGLQMMSVGSNYKFFIPPATGLWRGGGGPIPPNAALIFEVELLDIERLSRHAAFECLTSSAPRGRCSLRAWSEEQVNAGSSYRWRLCRPGQSAAGLSQVGHHVLSHGSLTRHVSTPCGAVISPIFEPGLR